ncbi:MAG: MOSC domain-containing protein, partial [Heliobacteriaceae bacterium]|nr:MOSC domain-containing protein [Heliobacteriaceae bacterium]
MGKVLAINVSKERGTDKLSINEANVVVGWGVEGDAHGGDWDRQVSILPVEALAKVPEHMRDEVLKGGYTENFTISGIPLEDLAVNKVVKIGEAIIKILHIGKEEPKEHGRPYIVSREGRFGKVIKGGKVKARDEVQ